MNIHKNARLTPRRREEMARKVIEGRCSKAHAARTYGVRRWLAVGWRASWRRVPPAWRIGRHDRGQVRDAPRPTSLTRLRCCAGSG